MSDPIVIIGAGGFGREVFGLVRALQRRGEDWEIVGFVDDAPTEGTHTLVRRLGSKIVGPVETLRSMTGIAAVIAIGSPGVRRSIADRLDDVALTWPTLIHPDATVGEDVTLVSGTVVAAGARLSTNIRCGRHVQIDQNATVGHDVCIEPFARLNPQACISGSVLVRSNALIGAGATVLAGLTIETDTVVGAGAVVTRSTDPHTTVKGVPAKVGASRVTSTPGGDR